MDDTETITTAPAVAAAAPGATPWHLWAVGIISLLWNAFGATDYVLTNLRSEAWLAQAGDPAEILGWIDGFPAWAHAMWAVGVWASIIGSVLLLMRSRHAVLAFVVSLVGAIVSFAYQFSTPMPPSLDTGVGQLIPFVIVAAIVLQWWYASRMRQRGVLR